MEVTTRSGKSEKVSFDKVIYRLTPLCEDLDQKYVDPILIALETIKSMYNGITTQQLDNLSADICASKISQHPDFNKLAARIAVSNLHKETKSDYNDVVCELFELGLISEEYYKFVSDNHIVIQNMLDYSRDFLFDFFGFKTLERSYLLRNKSKGKNKIIERPQHLWMRVAIQVHGLHPSATVDPEQTFKNIRETYDGISLQYFTQATPTLFNSGTKHPQLSSCFLLGIDDNIENIFKTLGDIGKISKWAGGIGIHLSDIRAKGSLIKGTNGTSDGIIPLCKVIESIGRYINQGGKRNGSIAIYVEVWHSDIFEFVELRKNVGDENLRARDLFLALWVCDLFMKRVQNDEDWTLMCPDKCKGLTDTYGEEFEKLYLQYELEGKYNKKVKAADLWRHILESQIETGMPYISYKDHVNNKSNQKNIGVIKSSNLCVSGDTLILTKNGYYPIIELVDSDVEIWNGKQWSMTTVRKTGENQKLITLVFCYEDLSQEIRVRCTEYHKVYIQEEDNIRVVQAKDLTPKMKIIQYKLPHVLDPMPQVYVKHIEDNGDYEDTYCFNEPLEHKGIFNGVILGNCNEIVEVSNSEETAVCNLASICLPKFVENNTYNFDKLRHYTKIATRNLNNIIDINYYPTDETRYSNFKNRPVGIGVQGLADVYCKLKIPFDSQEAKDLNKKIFEHLYFASLEASCELAHKYGAYQAFKGSPFSQGLLQWHLWGVDRTTLSSDLDWEGLIERVKTHGTRNSLLTALMPTASTSQIMKNCECFEPYSSNIFVRLTLAGEYIIVNEHLVRDLLKLGLWTKEIYNEILYFNGSVQNIKNIPQEIKNIYKTAFEIKGIDIVRQSIDRGPFIDQTQSLNIFQAVPDFSKLSSSHFYGWKNGLKTGMYYLRTQPAVDPIKFGLDPLEIKRIKEKYFSKEQNLQSPNPSSSSSSSTNSSIFVEPPKVCRRLKPGENIENCELCSS